MELFITFVYDQNYTNMSSLEIFVAIGDASYWVFINTLEPMGDLPWRIVLYGGFLAFGYWMYRQAKFNKIAAHDPDQLK